MVYIKRSIAKILALLYIFTLGFSPAYLILNTQYAHAETPPEYISQFGEPAAADQFVDIRGVAIGLNNYLYIVDAGLNAVKVMTTSGVYVNQWGTGGSGNGQFNLPNGIAVDSLGNIYVADTLNNRIQKFDEDGNFISKWGVSGSADGELSNPFALAISTTDEIYVTEIGNNRVQVFDSTGTFLSKWGSFGTADGEFNSPQGIAITDADVVYVADTYNSRIQKLNSSGSFIEKWSTSFPSWIALGYGNGVHVTSSISGTLSKYAPSSGFCSAVDTCPFGSFGIGDGQFRTPNGITVAPDGKVYVADTDNFRIQKFDSPAASSMSYEAQFGERAFVNPDQIQNPGVITTDSLGNVYVESNNIIKKFNASGTYVTEWGDAELSNITGVDTDSLGNVYVSDINTGAVVVYSSTGTYLDDWGALDGLTSMVIDSNDIVHISDYDYGTVRRYTTDGTFLDEWVPAGAAMADVTLAVDSNNDIYVIDNDNSTLKKYTNSGVFIAELGAYGAGDGEFQVPISVATDADNNFYITDGQNSRVQKYDSEGTFVLKWGSAGSGNGQFGLSGTPFMNIAIDPNGYIYVADYANNRVQKFGYAADPPVTPPEEPPVDGEVTDTVDDSTVDETSAEDEVINEEEGSTDIIINQYAEFFDSLGKDFSDLTVGKVLGFCIKATASSDCDTSNTDYHTATIKSIDDTDPSNPKVIITVASTPIDYILFLNSPKLIDVEDDGIEDIAISLLGVAEGKVSLNFRLIAVASVTSKPVSNTANSNAKKSNTVWYAVGAGFVAILLFMIYIRIQKNKV